MDLAYYLEKLRLTDKEVKLFLVLYELRKATPADLTRVTGIKRTTVYSVLEGLIKRGLITTDFSARATTYIVISPESFKGVLDQELRNSAKDVDLAAELLKEFIGKSEIQIPKVVFIQENQIEKHLYSRVPIWNKSMKDTKTDYVGFLDYTFTEKYLEWIDWYWKHPTTKNIKLRFLTNETELEKDPDRKKLYKRRNLRFWEEAGEITYNTWINGDYTIMINSRTKPNYLIEIFDKDLAASQREIFNAIWKETS